MQKQRLFVNSLMSIGQAITLTIIPFVLYRYLIEVIGAEQLGLWSLILSTTSMTRIGDLGLSASVVKFVAKYVALERLDIAADMIQTALISTGVLIAVLVMIVYPIATIVLRRVVPMEVLGIAINILPIALISLFFLVLNGVMQSGLDGYQRIDIRSYITIGSTIFYFVLCLILAPKFSLIGLAYAQLIQAVLTLIVNWYFLRRIFSTLPYIPLRWKLPFFKEMFGYGVNFQIATIANLLCEPTTMALLSYFGSLSLVAYYQLAKKLVTQVRALILTGNQAMVPLIAERYETMPGTIRKTYINSQQALTFIAVPAYSLVVTFSPIFAVVLIGEFQLGFVLFTALLSLGWFINTLSAPAYYMNMGSGRLGWNTLSHILMATLNGILGFALGLVFGATGVVVGWVISLSVGGIFLIIAYHRVHNIHWQELNSVNNLWVLICSQIATGFCLFVNFKFLSNLSIFVQGVIMSVLFSGVMILPLWFHPARSHLLGWVFSNLPKMRLHTS